MTLPAPGVGVYNGDDMRALRRQLCVYSVERLSAVTQEFALLAAKAMAQRFCGHAGEPLLLGNTPTFPIWQQATGDYPDICNFYHTDSVSVFDLINGIGAIKAR